MALGGLFASTTISAVKEFTGRRNVHPLDTMEQDAGVARGMEGKRPPTRPAWNPIYEECSSSHASTFCLDTLQTFALLHLLLTERGTVHVVLSSWCVVQSTGAAFAPKHYILSCLPVGEAYQLATTCPICSALGPPVSVSHSCRNSNRLRHA